MVREARREAKLKGNTLPEVTMSTVEARAEIRNEITYNSYIGNGIWADMPETIHSDVLPKVAHTLMTQLELKRGLREFGDRGKEAVSSELMQIHMQDTCVPTYGGDMTSEEWRQALESLLFLEENGWGRSRVGCVQTGVHRGHGMKKGRQLR